MPTLSASLPRPRTIAHPGPCNALRIEHQQSPLGRHFRLALPPGRTVYDAVVALLADVGVHNASMTLLGGTLDTLLFCLAGPDTSGRVVATYGPPETVRSAGFIFGNATLGRSASGKPVVHCHAVFATAQGGVRGGHVLTEETTVGDSPVTVLATALDGFELRVSHDAETGMALLRPVGERAHA